MTEKEAFAELIDNCPKHGTMVFASEQEAHDFMQEQVGAVLQQLRGTPAFPSEAVYLRTMRRLWMDFFRGFCPRV